jgi:hypothetical protein
MKAVLTTIAMAIATLMGQPASADLIPGSQTRVANWTVGAYDKNGKFSHCAMSGPLIGGRYEP